MQELIAQVEELGIEINHTTSLVIIFGIIFLTAIIVHFILHKVVLRAFEKRAQASSHLWLQIITQNKLFHRLAFTLQGIIVNVQAVLWLQKGSEAAELLTTCAKLWVMVYALLSFFSLLDGDFQSVAENGHRVTAAAEGDIPGHQAGERHSGGDTNYLPADRSVTRHSDKRPGCDGCRSDAGL